MTLFKVMEGVILIRTEVWIILIQQNFTEIVFGITKKGIISIIFMNLQQTLKLKRQAILILNSEKADKDIWNSNLKTIGDHVVKWDLICSLFMEIKFQIKRNWIIKLLKNMIRRTNQKINPNYGVTCNPTMLLNIIIHIVLDQELLMINCIRVNQHGDN